MVLVAFAPIVGGSGMANATLCQRLYTHQLGQEAKPDPV